MSRKRTAVGVRYQETTAPRGDITYGNIGTAKRLDFTVIGPAVNEAARIEDLCKSLGEPVLTSSVFAQSVPGELRSLGQHSLRGVRVKEEIFALPAEAAGSKPEVPHV